MKWIKNILKSTYFHIFSSLVICAIVIIFLILPGYNYAWTGFNSDTDPKTLWDWLELLIIPFVLAVGGYYLAKSEREEDREIAKQERETDLEIALNRQEELQVQNYLDRMTELLIDKDLLNSEKEEIINIAKARTTTILKSITDKTRQATIIQFLRASNLLANNQKIQLLKNAYLREADLIRANLREADLSGADLNGTYLIRANLREADLREANLREADLSGADLSGADLNGTYLIRANLRETDLREANLREADLREANLREADLSGADLSGADLNGTYLIRANLREADLREANLSGAILFMADLREVNLSGAILSGAILFMADLSGAGLSGADLTNVYGLTIYQLISSKNLKNATLPNGNIYIYEEVTKEHIEEIWPESIMPTTN